MTVGFIGLGNMAKAIIGGLISEGKVAAQDIVGSANTVKTEERMQAEFGIRTARNNKDVAAESDVLFLAVKPVFMADVIAEIKDEMKSDALVITIAAGKPISFYEEHFGISSLKLVRCMPNTPAMVGEGCTGVCTNDNVKPNETEMAIDLLSSFGKAFLVPERLMDVVGAVSGSSPAFVFMFIEAMADGAVAGGMPRAQAYEFAAQAVLGSAKLMLETGLHPGVLKDMVCSPGGTTIEGVKTLEECGLRASVMDAMEATIEKSRRL